MTERHSDTLLRVATLLHPISFGLYLGSLGMYVAEVQKTVQLFGMGKTESEAMRLLSTIRHLFESGDWGLGVVLTAFTLVFPIGKYLALSYVLASRSEKRRQRVLTWIKNLGQWSMGDVFVVALLVVMVRINSSVAQVHVVVLAGLWVFAASVLTSMIVSALLGFHFSADPNSGKEEGASGVGGSFEGPGRVGSLARDSTRSTEGPRS